MGYKRIQKSYTHPHKDKMYIWDYHKSKVLKLKITLKYARRLRSYTRFRNRMRMLFNWPNETLADIKRHTYPKTFNECYRSNLS